MRRPSRASSLPPPRPSPRQGHYDQAFKEYYAATTLSPKFVLAQYGLGQMHIHKGRNDKAISCFERVLEIQPGNYGAMKILASLYSRTDSQTQQEKAQKLFRKVRLD